MGLLEKMITACVIGAFIFLIFLVNYDNPTVVYDCNHLYQHQYVPERIIDECYRINKPVHTISI